MKIANGKLMAAVLVLTCAAPLSAVDVYSAFYFLTTAANTCTAEPSLADNTYIRIYAANACGNLARYAVRKGNGPFSFDNEWYVLDPSSGFLEIMSEVMTNPGSGLITECRVFRDDVSGEKGLPWLPITFNKQLGKNWVTNIAVEDWNHSCPATTVLTSSPFTSTESATFVGTWPAFLQDKRARSINQNTYYPVDVIRKRSTWGTVEENYYYGRWTNPATNTQEGIGLVKFQRFDNGVQTNLLIYSVLADGTKAAFCPTCPP